jgi:hypothetical protein
VTLCERSEPRLDIATKLSGEADGLLREAQWRQTIYPGAGEVVLWCPMPERPEVEVHGEDALIARSEVTGTLDRPELEAEEEAAKSAKAAASARARARTKVRRYCKANRLDRLFTLTYERGETDPDVVAQDVRRFFIALRATTGRLPYLWVRERHKSGALHVHFALDRPLAVRCGNCNGRKGLHVRRIGGPCLRCTWGLGFVDARRLKVTTGRQATVAAAAYLAKYVGKAYDDDESGARSEAEGSAGRNRHRYEVGQGFKPVRVEAEVIGPEGDVLEVLAGVYFGGRQPLFVWSSDVLGEEWEAPPVRVAFFDPPPG